MPAPATAVAKASSLRAPPTDGAAFSERGMGIGPDGTSWEKVLNQ